MKNLNLIFAVVLVAIFSLTSCQKEGVNSIGNETGSTELMSTTSDDPSEMQNMEENFTNKKGKAFGQLSLKERSNLPAVTPIRIPNNNESASSRHNWNIRCGQVRYNNNNAHSTNFFSATTYSNCMTALSDYDAPDVFYRLIIEERSMVTIRLNQLSADLDLFLFENNGGGLGNCLDVSLGYNSSPEQITITLEAGNYWILIDGYNTQQISNYVLHTACQPIDNCLFSDDFDSYQVGSKISVANPVDWRQYKLAATRDGIVNNVKSVSGNKSLRLKWRNGVTAQNQPRDLAKLGNYAQSGKYELSFQLFVPANKNAKFALNKYMAPGSVGIEFFFRQNGSIFYRNQGQVSGVGYYAQDQWLDIRICIDLNNRIGRLMIGSNLIMTWNTATHAYNPTAMNNRIGGLQFHAYHTASKFFVDDICFKEKCSGASSGGGGEG